MLNYDILILVKGMLPLKSHNLLCDKNRKDIKSIVICAFITFQEKHMNAINLQEV